MAGSVDLFLNISNGLDENLKKSEKSLSGMNNIAERVNKNMTDMNKSSNMLNDDYDDIVKSSEKATKNTEVLSAALSKSVGFAKKLGGALLAGFTVFGILDVVQNTFKLNQEMADLSYRMGEGGKTAHDLESAVTGVTTATGASIEASTAWIIGLREMRVATGDLEELSTAGYRFSEITGASEESTRGLIGSLSTMGGLGTKAIKGMLKEMVAVQRAFGLSKADMDRLTDSITISSQKLRSMGKSAAEVASFSSGVTKLAGAFASVGLNAETATKFVAGLLDPGAIEDNAFLYAKLGVSMQDAMEGNIDPSKLIGGFKNLGAELKGMSNFAANDLAKSLGMPLNELRQMAEMDESELNKALGGTLKISEDLKEEQDAQAKAQKDMAAASEKLKTIFVDIALKAMPTINKATGFIADNIEGWIEKVKGFAEIAVKFFKDFGISAKQMGIALGLAVLGVIFLFTRMKKKFASVSTDMGKQLASSLTSGITEAMDMGAKKSASKFEKTMKAGTNAYTEDLKQRIMEGTDYAAKQSAGNFYRTMAGTNVTKGTKKMLENSAAWLDKISMGAKPVSLITKSIEKGNAKMWERVKAEEMNSFQMKGAYEEKKAFNTEAFKGYQIRLDELDAMRKVGKLTPAQIKEEGKLLGLRRENGDAQLKLDNELAKVEEQRNSRKRFLLKNTLPEERKLLLEALNVEIQTGQAKLNSIGIDKAANQLQLDALNSSKEDLGIELNILNEKIKSGNFDKEDSARQLEILAAQKLQNELISIEVDRKASLANTEKEIENSMEKTKNNRYDVLSVGQKITREKVDEYDTQLLILQKELELDDVSEERHKQLSADIDRVKKQQMGALAEVDANATDKGKGFGANLKTSFKLVTGNFVAGIKSGMNKIGDSFKSTLKAAGERFKPSNIRAAISKAGDGNFFKGLTKVFKKGGKDIGGDIKKNSKVSGGPMLILGAIIMKLLRGNEDFKKMLDKVKKVFQDLAAKLMPIVMKLFDSLMPILMSLIDALMPVFEALIPIFMMLIDKILLPLVKMLLPPLLQVLAFLVGAIGKLIVAIGTLIKRWGGGDGMIKFGETLVDAADQLKTAASTMKASFKTEAALDKLKETLSGKTDSTEKDQLAVAKDQLRVLYDTLNKEENAKYKDVIESGNLDEAVIAGLITQAEATLMKEDQQRNGQIIAANKKLIDEMQAKGSAGSGRGWAGVDMNKLNELIKENEDLKSGDPVQELLQKKLTDRVDTRFSSLTGGLKESDIEELNKTQLDLLDETLNKIADKADSEGAGKADSVEGITTKLYPSIIEATSSGFVKTEDARSTMSGSPEAIQEALAREALEVDKRRNELLEESNSLNAVTADSTKGTNEKTGVNNGQATFQTF